MKKQTSIRLAADIGGTFTDIVLETPTDLYTAKVSTDTVQPELGVLSWRIYWSNKLVIFDNTFDNSFRDFPDNA